MGSSVSVGGGGEVVTSMKPTALEEGITSDEEELFDERSHISEDKGDEEDEDKSKKS